VLDILGQGTFGQVVKCQRILTKELVSVKVIKNKPDYKKQSDLEVEILKKVGMIVVRFGPNVAMLIFDHPVHQKS
jgi:serine/threonine protein kinase